MSESIENTENYEKPQGNSSGLNFFLNSWAGRILIVNTVIFLLMSYVGKGIMQPPDSVLIQFGAHDPIRLVQGEWWRLITPIFVHIGVIHFLFNSYALKFIGPQIEGFLGTAWFLGIYLVSGVVGNISSGAFHVMIGAGASGAIFGLIGAGLVVENYVRKSLPEEVRKSRSAWGFTSLAVLNLALGSLIPGIDNAAHMGGLLAGIVITLSMLRIKPNRLVSRRPMVGFGLIIFFIGFCVAVSMLRLTKSDLANRLDRKASEAALEFSESKNDEDTLKSAQRSYYFYTRSLRLDPELLSARFGRGKLLLISGDRKSAIRDLKYVSTSKSYQQKLRDLRDYLEKSGRQVDAWTVNQLLSEYPANIMQP